MKLSITALLARERGKENLAEYQIESESLSLRNLFQTPNIYFICGHWLFFHRRSPESVRYTLRGTNLYFTFNMLVFPSKYMYDIAKCQKYFRALMLRQFSTLMMVLQRERYSWTLNVYNTAPFPEICFVEQTALEWANNIWSLKPPPPLSRILHAIRNSYSKYYSLNDTKTSKTNKNAIHDIGESKFQSCILSIKKRGWFVGLCLHDSDSSVEVIGYIDRIHEHDAKTMR